MKALFVTTQTNDTDSLVRAWDCWNEMPSARITYPHMGERNDAAILATAKSVRPDVILWIGGAQGRGNPAIETFKALREIAPTINLCCDSGDRPWHPALDSYRAAGCFNLQVGLDGHPDAPVDLITVTPVDPRPYDGPAPARDIACGFSGNFGVRSVRGTIVQPLAVAGLLTVRKRVTAGDGYPEHAHFMRRCRIVINTSFTGSAGTHHVKGRVLEAGFAGAALLEPAASPAAAWFPAGSFFTYADTADAARLLKSVDFADAAARAAAFAAIVRDRYHPSKIYGAMLERIGLAQQPVQPAAA